MKLIFCMKISMRACYKLIWFWWGWSSIPKVPKIASLQCLYNISKKKLEMNLIFCMQINVKVSYKLISTFGHQVSYKLILSLLMGIKHSQSTQGNKLQYLYNTSKKKLGMEFIICMQRNIKVSKNWFYRFWWKWPGMF